MKVKIVKTGKAREVNASYGLRLIEQGKATAIHKPSKPARKEKAEVAGDA